MKPACPERTSGGKMHVAELRNSRRLKRLLAVMLDGIPRSPFELNRDSGVVYNPAITELAHNGIVIASERMAQDSSRAHRYWIPREHIEAARAALKAADRLPEKIGEPVPAMTGSMFG